MPADTVNCVMEFPTYVDADGSLEEWLNCYRTGGIAVDRTDAHGMTKLVFHFPEPVMAREFLEMLQRKGLPVTLARPW